MRKYLLALLLIGLASPAWAVCVTLPYTLLNGATADATEVMADLNALNGCAINSAGLGVSAIHPNLLINGEMAIDQANEGAAVTWTSGGSAHFVDKWEQGATNTFSATGVTAQRVTDAPPDAAYSLKVTIGTGNTLAANDSLTIYQAIEADYLHDTGFGSSAAQTLSMSFWAKTSKAGTYTYALYNLAFTESYLTTCTLPANVWTYCYAVIPGNANGVWPTAGNGAGMYAAIALTSNATTGSPNAWIHSFADKVTGQTNLEVTTGATFQISSVKLEIATAPTAFLSRPWGVELGLAKREYQKTFPQGTAPAQSAGVSGALCEQTAVATAGTFGVGWRFAPMMRAAPTITTYNPSAANANWRDVTGSSDATVNVDPATARSTTGVNIAEQTTGMTAAHTLCIHAIADARL